MSNRIIVCGENGAEKSTLGKMLAEDLNWTIHLEILTNIIFR